EGGLEVRWGRKGESLKLLNGNTVEVDDWVGVIAAGGGIESLAGIMGGDATAVTLDTQDIYLEAAFWWPQAIQGRARRYNFSTDAAHRFERGVDYATTVDHIERITALIVEICGQKDKTVIGPVDDQVINLPERRPVSVRTARAEKVIGVPLSDERIADIFTRLGLPFTSAPGTFSVTPPTYRFDIEIEEDLIEEIARVYGFENIPAHSPVAPNAMRARPENGRSLFTLRRQLADLDYQEVLNFSFVEEEWEADLAANQDPIRLLNPIASQMSVMRSTLAGSLLANVRYNLNRKIGRVRVFEIAAVYLRDAEAQDGPLAVAGYRQPQRVAAIAYGPAEEEQWGLPGRNVDFFDIKGDLENLFLPKVVRFASAEHPALHPGRSAQVLLDGQPVGFIGELHPRWQQKYGLPLAPVLFEVDAQALQARDIPAYRDISRFPAVTRDIALVVPQTTPAQDLLDTFGQEKQSNPLCGIAQVIVLFDEYKGKGLENHEKSLAFRFTLQDTQTTLNDNNVDAAMEAFVAAAIKRHGARLRT
ncbi:MAG: phenylalanine--tRNA ligase subunit beta, partial [Noviherbaspirillum sp.]